MVTVSYRPAAVETGVALKVAKKTLAMLAKH